MTEKLEAERAAFEAFYTEHYWALLRFAVRRLPDHDSARDLVADTFAVAWQRRRRIPLDRPLPWLYRVAGNLLANRRRREARADEAIRRLASSVAGRHAPGPDERAEWSEALEAALAVLRTLGPRDQAVLLLHAWEDLHGDDLAAALGCSARTAAVRLHRARSRLKSVYIDALTPLGVDGTAHPARASGTD